MRAPQLLSKTMLWTRVGVSSIYLFVLFSTVVCFTWHRHPITGLGIAFAVTIVTGLQLWRNNWRYRSSGSGSGDAGFSSSDGGSCDAGGGCSG